MKRCSLCKKVMDDSEFYKDSRTKDGLQAFCKSCKKKRQIARRNGKVTPKKVAKHQKLVKLAMNIADGNSPAEAYHKLGTTKTVKVASSSAGNFLKQLDDEEMNMFRKMLTPPALLKAVEGFFMDVLSRRIDVSIDEYNRTLDRWIKLSGTAAPEKVETRRLTLTKESRVSMREEMAELLRKKETT